MQYISKDTHPSLYLLADHLEAALAMGEDLLASKVDLVDMSAAAGDMDLVVGQNEMLAQFMSQTRTLEISLISRLMQARKWAGEIKNDLPHLKPVVQLFLGGTAALMDAVAELGDTTTLDFETGNTAVSFLRTRGIVTPADVGIAELDRIVIGEDYLVAGFARLGTLLDLVAAFLDTLDLVGDLRISDMPRPAREAELTPVRPH